MDIENVKDFWFEFVRFVLNSIQAVTWRYYDIIRQLRSNTYERSAQVCKILLRHKGQIYMEFSSKSDFIFVHKDFCHPCIILNDNISLYSVNKKEAIFVDCGNIDVFDSIHDAFVYNTQFRHAVNLITVPIESLHQIAKEMPLPKIPIIHLANHGRCGSTLITKMFEAVPNSLSMSEPNAYTDLAELSRKGRLARSELVKLCYSISLCIFKHASTRKSEVVFLKGQNVVTYVTDIMAEALPSIKQVYMYRDPLPTMRSWEKLYIANKWSPPTVNIVKLWAGIGHNDLLKRYPVYPFHYINDLDFISKISLTWIAGVAAFNELVSQDYTIKSLRYEDLLEDPETTIKALFHYAGLPDYRLPDVREVMNKDSQKGTLYTTRHFDQDRLKESYTKLTEKLRAEIDTLCSDFSVPLFWERCHLPNKL